MAIVTPEWVKDAVFYQIFPDRFARSGRVKAPGPFEAWDVAPTVHGFKGGDLYGISDRLDELAERGVVGFKAFMCETGIDDFAMADDETLHAGMARAARLGLPVAVHAEDEETIRANKAAAGDSATLFDHPKIRSPEAALKATQLAVELSKKYGRRLHVLHMTTEEEVRFLEKEKTPGVISAEVCPQHFLLEYPKDYERLGTYAQMNPPIREARHGKVLWQALKDGVIDCMATDHAPHTREEKGKGYPLAPAGMPAEVVRRLNAEVGKILQAPDVLARLATLGIDPWSSSPEAFGETIKADIARILADEGYIQSWKLVDDTSGTTTAKVKVLRLGLK